MHMRYGRYGWPNRFIRWGLGITFLWIGVDILRNTTAWIGFVPEQVPFGLSRETAIKLGGIADIGLGALLMTGHWPKLVAGLVSLHLVGIIVTNGLDAVIIRDVGLLGAALALFFWPYHRRKKWLKFDKKKRVEPAED